jgi:hypothetical protein
VLILTARAIYVALIACEGEAVALSRRTMDNEPWQLRAQAAGLEQKTLARLLGRPVNTISRQIRGLHGGVPQHLVAVIIAWERMTDAERVAWVADVEAEMQKASAELKRRERKPKPGPGE